MKSGDLFHVCRLGALLSLDYLELDTLTFRQSLEALTQDRAEVDKDIVAFVGGDETIPLGFIEPFDRTLHLDNASHTKKSTGILTG
jgi:hypothetical protein